MNRSSLLLVFVLLLSIALPAMAQKKLKTAQDYFKRAIQYSEAEKFDLALADYKASLKLDSLECGIYNNIGGIYSRKKNFDLALQNYTEAYKCSKSMYNKTGIIMSLWNRGLCKHEMGDFQGASQDYSTIITIDSSSTTGYILKSLEYLFLRQYDEAMAAAQQVLALPKLTEDSKLTVERIKAHAQMFKGDITVALAIHKVNQEYQFDYATWKQYVAQEFAAFRKAGLSSENMSKVEALLGLSTTK